MHEVVEPQEATRTSPATEFLPMNGGDGTNSYFQNSDYQRIAANNVKGKIQQEITKSLDCSISKTIRIADLGCSTGPNTFIAMQNIVEAIKLKHKSQCPNSKLPEFQVFFSDRTSNDFNTLFKSVPRNTGYFAAGVPGSFHGRLFPESSLHFVYSAHALHWLSELPPELVDSNKGRIYYLNAPKQVSDSYASRFFDDVDGFLNARAREIVEGGLMVILVTGRPSEVSPQCHLSPFSLEVDFIGSIFMEMAKEGLLSEDLVDSFNIPIYEASAEEVRSLVKKNGNFSVERIELLPSVLKGITTDVSVRIKHTRAGLERMLSNHFGTEITDQMFERLHKKLEDNSDLLTSVIKESGQLFIALKRK